MSRDEKEELPAQWRTQRVQIKKQGIAGEAAEKG